MALPRLSPGELSPGELSPGVGPTLPMRWRSPEHASPTHVHRVDIVTEAAEAVEAHRAQRLRCTAQQKPWRRPQARGLQQKWRGSALDPKWADGVRAPPSAGATVLVGQYGDAQLVTTSFKPRVLEVRRRQMAKCSSSLSVASSCASLPIGASVPPRLQHGGALDRGVVLKRRGAAPLQRHEESDAAVACGASFAQLELTQRRRLAHLESAMARDTIHLSQLAHESSEERLMSLLLATDSAADGEQCDDERSSARQSFGSINALPALGDSHGVSQASILSGVVDTTNEDAQDWQWRADQPIPSSPSNEHGHGHKDVRSRHWGWRRSA